MKHSATRFFGNPRWKVKKTLSKRHLLFEGARLRIFCHDIMQRLHADVNDAAELVLDDAANTQRLLN